MWPRAYRVASKTPNEPFLKRHSLQRIGESVLGGDEAGFSFSAFEGRKGAELRVFSTKDGSIAGSLELDSAPAFDGLSAARGRLYLATEEGKVICFGAP